jgi:hypothetical protein
MMRTKTILTAVLVVAMMAGGSVLALMRPDKVSEAGDGRPRVEMVIAVEKVLNGEAISGTVRVSFEDPEELPDTPEGSVGLFLARQGDTLTVGQGEIEVEVDVEVTNGEEPVHKITAIHKGDEAQIRVTAETVVLEDVTELPEISDEDIAAGELVVTRVVKPGSLEGIGENMLLRAWGVDQDGQLVAELLVLKPIR